MPRNEIDPNQVVLNLLALARQIQELSDQLDQIEEDAVNAREDFTLAHAKAFLRAEGPMDIRKYTAIEQTHVERIQAELAETKVRGMKRQIDTLKTRIDVGRSAAALVRAESELLNVRGRA
jgi:hypothetical protein